MVADKVADILQETIRDRDRYKRALELAAAERATISGEEELFMHHWLYLAEAPEGPSTLELYRSRCVTGKRTKTPDAPGDLPPRTPECH